MELTDISAQLKEIETRTQGTLNELKSAMEERIKQVEQKGVADPELKEKIDRLNTRIDVLDQELHKADPTGLSRQKSLTKTVGEQVSESAEYKAWKEKEWRTAKGMRFPVQTNLGNGELKSIITTGGLGSGTSGVLMPVQLPGIVQLQRQRLTVRDLLPTRPTSDAAVMWMKENVFTNAASPQVEGSAKAESTITYTTASTAVKTIAHWVQVTRQALADAPWLQSNINDNLMYGLKLKEESEILRGDGLGSHLSGIITNASAYAGTYNVAGDTQLDRLRHAILEARLALYPVDGIVMNPVDMHKIELLKDENGGAANTGRYIIGDPRGGVEVATAWGRPVVEADSMTPGTFLVGAFGLGAILFDRMNAVIDISFEHGTNFTENEATILCEERLALAMVRSASFIYGTF